MGFARFVVFQLPASRLLACSLAAGSSRRVHHFIVTFCLNYRCSQFRQNKNQLFLIRHRIVISSSNFTSHPHPPPLADSQVFP